MYIVSYWKYNGPQQNINFGNLLRLVYKPTPHFGSKKLPKHSWLIYRNIRGGLELLFKNQKEHKVTLPAQETKWTIEKLIAWLKDNLLQEREELFVQGKTVRPGILVLINDSDWELMGELEYEIEPGDTIVFISTLHGG